MPINSPTNAIMLPKCSRVEKRDTNIIWNQYLSFQCCLSSEEVNYYLAPYSILILAHFGWEIAMLSVASGRSVLVSVWYQQNRRCVSPGDKLLSRLCERSEESTTTRPQIEIQQCFGEIIRIWLSAVWLLLSAVYGCLLFGCYCLCDYCLKNYWAIKVWHANSLRLTCACWTGVTYQSDSLYNLWQLQLFIKTLSTRIMRTGHIFLSTTVL